MTKNRGNCPGKLITNITANVQELKRLRLASQTAPKRAEISTLNFENFLGTMPLNPYTGVELCRPQTPSNSILNPWLSLLGLG